MYSCTILVTDVKVPTWTGRLANNADPNQMPQNVASDLGLHCLLKLQEIMG